jgi:hypothetical protein
MRGVMTAFGVSQLLLSLMWGWVWLTDRRQRPAPDHLRQPPPVSPDQHRRHATLAATLGSVSLAVAIVTLTQAWMSR